MEEACSKVEMIPVARSDLSARDSVLMNLIDSKAHQVNNSVTDAYDTVGRLHHKEKENNQVHSKYEAQARHCHDLPRKRKYYSDGEGVCEAEEADRSCVGGNTRPWKRLKARTTSSLPYTELLVRPEETGDGHDDATSHALTNEPPTSGKCLSGRFPTSRPNSLYSRKILSPSSNRDREASPVYTPPSPTVSRNVISRGQLVDWTFVSDEEESVAEEDKHMADSQRIAIPASSTSSKQASLDRDGTFSPCDDAQDSAVDSNDTGYDGASEWEGLSEASLQNYCREHGNTLLDAIGVSRTFSRQCTSGSFVHGDAEPATPEGTCASALIYNQGHQTPSLFTPSPLNSDDYRRLGDLSDDFVPSPLSSKDIGNDESHQSPSHANSTLRSFYDSSERLTPPLLEAQGYAEGQDGPELLQSNEPLSNAKDSLETFEDATSDRQSNIGSLLFRPDERSSPPTSVALADGSQCMRRPFATISVVGRLLPVFDWSTPVFPPDELDGAVSRENSASASEDTGSEFSGEFLYDDKVWVEKWATEVQAASAREEAD